MFTQLFPRVLYSDILEKVRGGRKLRLVSQNALLFPSGAVEEGKDTIPQTLHLTSGQKTFGYFFVRPANLLKYSGGHYVSTSFFNRTINEPTQNLPQTLTYSPGRRHL